ncbi:MAG: hypothetical protein ACRDTJ_21055 [Pseudonocardiaceae bacterium]
MTITCLHCGAETTNGLALCSLCQGKVTVDFERIGLYFTNLARWSRPARPNGSLGSRSQWMMRRGESDSNRVGRALDEAGTKLVGWARQLEEERGAETPADAEDEATTIRLVCDHLTAHLTSIGTCDWAGDLARGTAELEEDLRVLAEYAVPGWYAGECRRCRHPTWVMPGFTWVTCGGCGTTTYARDHLEQVLTEAREWVARPKPMAEAIVALIDTEQSVPRVHDRIRIWNSRSRLVATRALDDDGDPVGPKRYRFGDVLDLVLGDNVTAGRIEGTTAV